MKRVERRNSKEFLECVRGGDDGGKCTPGRIEEGSKNPELLNQNIVPRGK